MISALVEGKRSLASIRKILIHHSAIFASCLLLALVSGKSTENSITEKLEIEANLILFLYNIIEYSFIQSFDWFSKGNFVDRVE